MSVTDYRNKKLQFDTYVPVSDRIREAVCLLRTKWDNSIDQMERNQRNQEDYKQKVVAPFGYRGNYRHQSRQSIRLDFNFDAYLFATTGARFYKDPQTGELYVNEDSTLLILEEAGLQPVESSD